MFQKLEAYYLKKQPTWLKCNICNIKYSYFGKMDTFKEDATFILNEVKIILKYNTYCIN